MECPIYETLTNFAFRFRTINFTTKPKCNTETSPLLFSYSTARFVLWQYYTRLPRRKRWKSLRIERAWSHNTLCSLSFLLFLFLSVSLSLSLSWLRIHSSSFTAITRPTYPGMPGVGVHIALHYALNNPLHPAAPSAAATAAGAGTHTKDARVIAAAINRHSAS